MDAAIWLEFLRLLFTVQMSTSFMSAAAAGPFQREPPVRRNLFMFADWAIIWRGCWVCGLGGLGPARVSSD